MWLEQAYRNEALAAIASDTRSVLLAGGTDLMVEVNEALRPLTDTPVVALTRVPELTLEDVAEHPIVTYVFGFTGRSKLDEAFVERGLVPRVVFTAADADVIKTYVRLGLGIGIVAGMAYDETADQDLVALDASHLFASSVTKIGCRRGTFLRGYMYEFIEDFAPHLNRDVVQEAFQRHTKAELDELFSHLELPVY